jgi:hypothetical protein
MPFTLNFVRNTSWFDQGICFLRRVLTRPKGIFNLGFSFFSESVGFTANRNFNVIFTWTVIWRCQVIEMPLRLAKVNTMLRRLHNIVMPRARSLIVRANLSFDTNRNTFRLKLFRFVAPRSKLAIINLPTTSSRLLIKI